jgi:hypothetical protein
MSKGFFSIVMFFLMTFIHVSMVNINTFMVDAAETGPYGLSPAFLCAYDQFMV